MHPGDGAELGETDAGVESELPDLLADAQADLPRAAGSLARHGQ
jgi:hypothetical protein